MPADPFSDIPFLDVPKGAQEDSAEVDPFADIPFVDPAQGAPPVEAMASEPGDPFADIPFVAPTGPKLEGSAVIDYLTDDGYIEGTLNLPVPELPEGAVVAQDYAPGKYKSTDTGELFDLEHRRLVVDTRSAKGLPSPQKYAEAEGVVSEDRDLVQQYFAGVPDQPTEPGFVELPVFSDAQNRAREIRQTRPYKSVEVEDGIIDVEINPSTGEEWLALGEVAEVPKTSMYSLDDRDRRQAQIDRTAGVQSARRDAVMRVAEKALESGVFPESQMAVGLPHMEMALRREGLLRVDPNDPEVYWAEFPSEDGSPSDPVQLSKAKVELVARSLLSNKLQEDREFTRTMLNKSKDPKRKAEVLYSFLKTYYPRAARSVSEGKGGEIFNDIEVDQGSSWFATIMGVGNALEIALPPLAASRKGLLELKNRTILERLAEGQYEVGELSAEATAFDDVETDIVNDYLATNHGHRMENGNYLLPIMGTFLQGDAPTVWPEDLTPDERGGDSAERIDGKAYAVLSPRRFRAVLLEDLQANVSLLGKLNPKRWMGMERGFTEVDPAEAWRRLGLRRFIGYGTGPDAREHLFGEHFPGFTETTKKGEYGEDVSVPFVEDLAKAISSIPGGIGTSITDTMAEESGKDIAAIGALPYRGVQDIWRIADEGALDLMELIYPKGARPPDEDPTGVGIDSRSQQIWAELSPGGEEGQTRFKYDPEIGIDPLGNVTFEMAGAFMDPYALPAAKGLMGVGHRVGSKAYIAEQMAKKGRVHSRVGLLTKEGGDALDSMIATRVQAAADELGVALSDISSAAKQKAQRQAVNEFAHAHAEANKAGQAIESISYQTELVAAADGAEKLVIKDLLIASEEGAVGMRADLNLARTDDLGVELIGGVWPSRTGARTQFQYKNAYRKQIREIVEAERAAGGARLYAVDTAAKVFSAVGKTKGVLVDVPLRTMNKVIGTDWKAVGGATPKEAWAIVRGSLTDLGYGRQEMAEFSNKILTRQAAQLREAHPDFDLSKYTVEDLILSMKLQEINGDIVLDERLMTEVVGPLREFLDGARSFEDEFLRMDGNFRLFLEDPRGREAIEELKFAQWQQKYREIAATHPPGSDQRVTAIKDSMLALEEDFAAIQNTLGRMERGREIRALEDAMVETLEQAALFEERAEKLEKQIPRRLGKRTRVPASATPQSAVDDLIDTATSARNEAAELQAEINRLGLDLVEEIPAGEQRLLSLRDTEVKKSLRKRWKKNINRRKAQLVKLEEKLDDYRAAYDDAIDIPSTFIPEKRGLEEAFSTRASWSQADIPVEGASSTIKGERAGEFVVIRNHTVTDDGTIVLKKDFALYHAPEGSGSVRGVPASALESDDALTLWIRENPSDIPALQSEIDLANKAALEPFDEMVEVFHGAPAKAAGAIKEEGFSLTEGLRSGFLGGDKKVKSQAIFLTEDRSAARAFGSNKAAFPSDVEVFGVRADVRNTLDMSDWSGVPKSIRDDAMSRLSKYDGSELTEPRAEDFFWFLDQPEIVNNIKSHGFDSVRFVEDADTIKILGVDGPVSTLAVFDPKRLHMPKEPYRGLSGARDFIRSRQAGAMASSLERVAHGFKSPRDAKTFGDVAHGLVSSEGGSVALLEDVGVTGRVHYRDKKLFKPWEIQAGLGIQDAAAWSAKAQKAIRDQRQLSRMRESIESKRREIGSLETALGKRVKKPGPWQDANQSNRAVRREIADRERTMRKLNRVADSADRGAGRLRTKMQKEKTAIQSVARSELRSKMSAEARDLRAGARNSYYEHARRQRELRDLVAEIKADSVETAAALAVPRAIEEFNRAARISVEAKETFTAAEATRAIDELLMPEGTAPRSWKYQGTQKKKLTDKQKRLPPERQDAILAADKGTFVTGHVRGDSLADAQQELARRRIVDAELEAGTRSKLTEKIDTLQEEIGTMLNPAGGGGALDVLGVLGLTEGATPYQIVKKVLDGQQEALSADVQLARAVPGYDKKMDILLDRLEALTEEERFMVGDFLKFERLRGPERGGRYAGLTAEQEHLRPVIELFRGYYKEMLDLLQDQGMFKDWKLYEFLDRTNVSSYVPHTLAAAGFGLAGKARQLSRQAASNARIRGGGFLPTEAPPTMWRGMPGATHEINAAMRWQVAEGLAKYQAQIHNPEVAKLLKAGRTIPDEMVEAVLRELPEELLAFEQNPLLVASNYSINVGKIIGNRRWWDDLQMVVETNFPEMTNLSRQIGDPKLMIRATDDAYEALKAEAVRLDQPIPPRESGVVYSRALANLDEFARERGMALYGENFERLGGADYMSLVTGGKFPSGDSAVLDAINLMVTRGDDVADVQKQLLHKFGLEISVAEAKSFTRGQVYLPAALRDFVRAQLGHSDLATTLRNIESPHIKGAGQLVLDTSDNVNEIFKGMVTVVWPRFHGRNSWGGMIANAMIHGAKGVEPELQKKFVMMLSREGADIPFTWGKHTYTGSEWQDIMRRTHVTPDRGGVADIEATISGAERAGLGPTEIERMRAAADRVIKKFSEGGESRLEVWDEIVDYLYDAATMKEGREAWHAEKHTLPSTGLVHELTGGKMGQKAQWGRLKTGPAGKAVTGTGGGLVVGLTAGMTSGSAGVTGLSGLVGATVGFMSTMPARKLVALGGEIGLLTETQLRGTNFVAGLEMGHSIEEAAWLATHTHFNYNPHGQSWFSYNVLRRMFPFWTWNSKNFKKQLWLMRHRPQEYAALQHIITTGTHYESSPELEATLPPSFSSRIALHMREGAWHGFGTPFEAFVEALRPQQEGGLPGTAGLGGLLHPMALWGYEELSGRSLYFDKPLEEIRSARDLQYLGWAPFLQEYFGAGPSPENPEIWKLGVLDSSRPENKDKPWIPDSIKEATTRWNRVRKLNSLGALMSMWQQVRAEAYQDAYGELDPAGMKVTIPERIARVGLSWRRYHYDSNETSVKHKAWRRMIGRLKESAETDDPQGWDFYGGMKKEGYDRFATEESDELLRELLLQSDQQDPLQQ